MQRSLQNSLLWCYPHGIGLVQGEHVDEDEEIAKLIKRRSDNLQKDRAI